jgi:hypothetical protein
MKNLGQLTSQSSTRSGFSIAGALVALSITAVGSAAVVSMIENNIKGAQYVESKMEISSLMTSIGVVLAETQNCAESLKFDLPGNNASESERSNHWFTDLGAGVTGRKLISIRSNGFVLVEARQKLGSAQVNSVRVLTQTTSRTQVTANLTPDTSAWRMLATLEIDFSRESGALAPGSLSRRVPIQMVVGRQSGRILACRMGPLEWPITDPTTTPGPTPPNAQVANQIAMECASVPWGTHDKVCEISCPQGMMATSVSSQGGTRPVGWSVTNSGRKVEFFSDAGFCGSQQCSQPPPAGNFTGRATCVQVPSNNIVGNWSNLQQLCQRLGGTWYTTSGPAMCQHL